MRNNSVINLLHRTLTLTLLTIIIGYLTYQQYFHGAPDDELYSTQQINDDTWLYITQYKGGGATISEVYRYYLSGKLDDAPMKLLAERAPFLVADVGNARVSGHDNLIDVAVTGRVYTFTNSALFYSENVAVMPVIDLTAKARR